MPSPISLRPRPGRPLRLAAAACVAGLGGAVAALVLATGPAAPVSTAAQPCLPLLCPTPNPTPTKSSTPKPTASRSSTPRPTSSHSNNPPPPPPPTDSSFPGYTPQGTPLPTLPPPSPGAPPEPPALEVEKIQLDIASRMPVQPGGEVLVQVTLEAQRDTDTYAVPQAPVTFSIAAQSGQGAFVDPESTDSGDTGVVVVKVQTGDQPGDTVLHATAGNAAGNLTIPSDPPTPTPTAQRNSSPPVAVNPDTNTKGPSRPLLVASLAALLAAMAGGYVAALLLGKLPNPFQRRVWGRRGTR